MRGSWLAIAALLIAAPCLADPTATPTPPAVGSHYLVDFVSGHSYATGSIDGRAPEVSLSGDTWHLTGGTLTVRGSAAYEESPGATAIIDLGNANAHYIRARITMPTILTQAEGGIFIRASSNASSVPNAGDYFYVGFHGTMFGVYDSDPSYPDRHYMSGAAAGVLIVNMPTQAQPISKGQGLGWYADIEIYDDGVNVVVLSNGVDLFGTLSIPYYVGNTFLGISGGDWGNVTDIVSDLVVQSSDGLTPIPTASRTATATRTPILTATATPQPTATPQSMFTQKMVLDTKPRKMRKP